ncbi:MAG: mandelate racemase/muconate lactonizing enzyme family protein [Alphaproteobacteria bacterium]
MPDTIQHLDLVAVSVTPKTVWTFLRLTSTSGITGYGEATLTGQEKAVAAVAARFSGAVVGASVSAGDVVFASLPFGTIAEAAFSSAVMQAMLDVQARTEGVPVASLLGGTRRSAIPTYANINRRTLDRSPAGFAASVAAAVTAGYDAFKIAPFDDLTPAMDAAEARPLIAAGITRIEAVRQEIGPDRRMMVDCHWRFRTDWALSALDALKSVGLYWFECPIPETNETLADLAKLRAHANKQDCLLAGLEMAVLRQGFRPFLEAGAYDVMMPDVKYVGGPDEMMRVAEEFARYGATFSPHNPSGPICHAHSLQICAAVPDLAVLGLQYDETARFDELVAHGLPLI